MTIVKLSVVIIAFNEARNIEECLNSVAPVADEILVVDSGSTDNTVAICERLGARVIYHSFEGHIQQKNFAMEQAMYDIVLSLDADERLDSTLCEEILRVKQDFESDGFVVNRLNNYCGKFIHFGEWNPDYKIRLWDRRIGRWGGENPHDKVIIPGNSIKKLRGRLLHFTYRNPADHFVQMQKFSDIAAQESHNKGKRTIVIVHQVLYPWYIFVKVYFLKLGFLDGYEGFILAIHAAYYRFLKYTKLKYLNSKKV